MPELLLEELLAPEELPPLAPELPPLLLPLLPLLPPPLPLELVLSPPDELELDSPIGLTGGLVAVGAVPLSPEEHATPRKVRDSASAVRPGRRSERVCMLKRMQELRFTCKSG
jgi:hypothetical protein